MRRVILLTAAVLVAVIVFLLVTLPPAPVRLALGGADPDLVRRTVRGAYHIHTSRSDGAEAKPAIAAAAARAGLQFLIFTDHGDGTRVPDPPVYVDGILCIDAVEVSTSGGHYTALDLPPAPYPLGGEAAAVVEDVRRLGGFGIVAHPDHPKTELAWTDWTVPIDGLEWLNADAEWRTEGRLALVRTVFDYLLRPAPAIASVLDRPSQTLQRWDALSHEARVTALAAVDAHGSGRSAEGEPRVAVGPSYEASFRTLTNRVVLDRPFTGDPAGDGRRLLDAIERGSVYTVVDAISPDVLLDIVAFDPDRLRVVSPLPAGAAVIPVSDGRARRLEVHAAQAPGDPPVPWVLTNWVYSREAPLLVPKPNVEGVRTPRRLSMEGWRVEKDPASEGDLVAGMSAVTLRYALGEGRRNSQFVAAATDLTEREPFGALLFRGRASRPMRISVQLRFPPDDARWVKSVYLDTAERDVVVALKDMVSADQPGRPMPAGDTARSLLFVVDLVNAEPGYSGEFTIGNARLER